MARQPVVGADSNAWGTVLNAYLSVAHNADGSYKGPLLNLKDPAYGGVCDGVTNDSTPWASALSAVQSAGGGGIILPGPSAIATPITIPNGLDNLAIFGVGNMSQIIPTAGFSGAALIYYAGGTGIH